MDNLAFIFMFSIHYDMLQLNVQCNENGYVICYCYVVLVI